MIGDLQLDTDVFRFVLVASIAIAFLVYTRLRLVAGGSVTGGFVAGLLLFGDWEIIIWVALLALVTVVVMRLVVLRMLPLSRTIAFQSCVLIGALLGILVIVLADPYAGSVAGGSWGIVVAYGALVTPGLTAYDAMHQGAGRTTLAIGLVSALTLLIAVPVLAVADGLPSGISTLTADESLLRLAPAELWLATIAAIALGMALRLSGGLRTGGFLGALFLAELLSWEAFLTVGAGAIATALVMRVVERRIVLTPRQRAQVALVLGALVAWAGLYWLAAAGWDPAIAANALRVSPLLAVGLIAADMGRNDSSIARTVAGVAVATALILAVVAVAQSAGIAMGALVLAALAVAVALPGAIRTGRGWQAAVASARAIALAEPRAAITTGATVATALGEAPVGRAAEAIERRRADAE